MDLDLRLLLPDLQVLLLALIAFLADRLDVRFRHWVGIWTVYGLVAIAGLQLGLHLSGVGGATLGGGMLMADGFALWGRLLVLLVSAAIGALRLDATGRQVGLWLLATEGAMILPGAGDLVTAYLGLELLALPLALLLSSTGRATAPEGALKHVLTSAVGSAIFLYGASWLFGLTGTTQLSVIAAKLAELGTATNGPMLLAALMVVAGLGFKLALVPFHAWQPDAVEASTPPQAAFLLTVPLIAVSALLLRVLHGALPVTRDLWVPALVLLSLASMTLGNLLAFVQSDLRRMLAYSAVGQVGLMLLGVMATSYPDTSTEAIAAIGVSWVGWALAMAGIWAVVDALETDHPLSLPDLVGLAGRSPYLAAMLGLSLVSLVGLPPLAGFWAKAALFRSLVALATSMQHLSLVWLVVIAALNTALIAAYGLRPLRLALQRGPQDPVALQAPAGLLAIATLGGIGSLLLFWIPQPLWQAALKLASGL